MKPLRCLTVDDEPHALEMLRVYIEKTPFLELGLATTSPWEALEYIQQGKADLVFLDIQMDGLTGLQLLDLVGKTTPVILTTAYSEYALKGYEYQVVDYLLKPFSFDRFLKAVDQVPRGHERPEAQTELAVSAPQRLFVKGDAKNKFHQVQFEDICYIEGLKNYVQFFCTSGKIISLQNLKDLESILPTERFVRIHKSYIINLGFVKQVEGNAVLLAGKRLPVGSSYRAAFFAIIEKNRLNG